MRSRKLLSALYASAELAFASSAVGFSELCEISRAGSREPTLASR
jgi:hypothetical protein